jgi:predicted nucleic acid-binding protein
MAFIVDSSVVLSWFFEDKTTDQSTKILDSIIYQAATCIAPYLLRLEVPNAILNAAKKKRINKEQSSKILSFFDLLPIEIDSSGALLTTKSTYNFAEKHNLTIYDACYLELAKQRSLPLATFDKSLITACKKEKIKVYL